MNFYPEYALLNDEAQDDKWKKWGCYFVREYQKHLWDHLGRCYGCSARKKKESTQ